MLPIYVVSAFTLLYIGGAYLGAREGLMFYQRFRRSVRRNDINNLKIKHLEMYMGGGYLLLDPKELTVLDGFGRDELVLSYTTNFDTVAPHADAGRDQPQPGSGEGSSDGGGGGFGDALARASRPTFANIASSLFTPPSSKTVAAPTAAAAAAGADGGAASRPGARARPGSSVSFFKLIQLANEKLRQRPSSPEEAAALLQESERLYARPQKARHRMARGRAQAGIGWPLAPLPAQWQPAAHAHRPRAPPACTPARACACPAPADGARACACPAPADGARACPALRPWIAPQSRGARRDPRGD